MIIDLSCDAHLGDSSIVVQCVKRLLELNNDVSVNLYVSGDQFYALSELFKHERYTIQCGVVPGHAIKTWVGNNSNTYQYRMSTTNNKFTYAAIEHMNDIFESLGLGRLPGGLKDMKFDFESISTALIPPGNYDVLFITSMPMSGQLDMNDRAIVDFILRHKDRLRFAITRKIDGLDDVFSTMEYGMSLSQLAAFSSDIPLIMGVNTCPTLFTDHAYARPHRYITFERNLADSSFGDSPMEIHPSLTKLYDITL